MTDDPRVRGYAGGSPRLIPARVGLLCKVDAAVRNSHSLPWLSGWGPWHYAGPDGNSAAKASDSEFSFEVAACEGR
jgi:hypothetical protein